MKQTVMQKLQEFEKRIAELELVKLTIEYEKMQELEKRITELEEKDKQSLNQEMYSYEDVAKLTKKSIRTIKEYEKRGWLRAKFPKAEKRFHKNDLMRFFQGR